MEKILIWGIKKNPVGLLEKLRKLYLVVGWVDSNPELQHQYIQKIYVYSPTEIFDIEYDKIIIGASIYVVSREIKNKCVEMGIPKEKVIIDYVMKTKTLDIKKIFLLQHKENKECIFENYDRMNLLIQYSFLEQYYGKNTVGFALAEKYMKAVCIEESRAHNHCQYFMELIQSMEQQGMKKDSYISLNKGGYLIDGTHRLAYLLWHNMQYVESDIYNTLWNLGENGERDIKFLQEKKDIFSPTDIKHLYRTYQDICRQLGLDANTLKRGKADLWEELIW